jgi:hypothetical protein
VVFITYTSWTEKWNEWIDPLNDRKISRIYVPDSKCCLQDLRVGERLYFFSEKNHVQECEVLAFSGRSMIKLKDLDPHCKDCM